MNINISIKIFIWRACRDILPTQAKPKLKNMVVEENCVFCHTGIEVLQHAFIACPTLQDSWKTFFLAVLEFQSLLDQQHVMSIAMS